ncbi:MAG TPA: hypothetical protein VGZ23_08855 [bacterium]|nr:hypothetical protein [bacterium]
MDDGEQQRRRGVPGHEDRAGHNHPEQDELARRRPLAEHEAFHPGDVDRRGIDDHGRGGRRQYGEREGGARAATPAAARGTPSRTASPAIVTRHVKSTSGVTPYAYAVLARIGEIP